MASHLGQSSQCGRSGQNLLDGFSNNSLSSSATGATVAGWQGPSCTSLGPLRTLPAGCRRSAAGPPGGHSRQDRAGHGRPGQARRLFALRKQRSSLSRTVSPRYRMSWQLHRGCRDRQEGGLVQPWWKPLEPACSSLGTQAFFARERARPAAPI